MSASSQTPRMMKDHQTLQVAGAKGDAGRRQRPAVVDVQQSMLRAPGLVGREAGPLLLLVLVVNALHG